ncbi:hypothetical protein ACFRFL_13815 [Streptomyces sp. NPDC056708]|uniref:hypothetical protein n=1 Tax=unclassified Streptomyces TaxID=2593676 RepID=UPI0036B179CA
MASNHSFQLGAAIALVELLSTHPELSALTWTATPVGVLRGEQRGVEGHGEIVDDCAEILGGTPDRVAVDGDGSGFAELATVWRGVLVQVWATYSAPAPRRKLGTVVPAGGAR